MRIALASFILLSLGQITLAQIAGQLKIEKSSYAVGEPFEIIFTAQNAGSEALEISLGDPYRQCNAYQVNGLQTRKPGASAQSAAGGDFTVD